MKVHELPPNAGRMINSLRDAGYDFNTAVADIVDNSIAAGATLIDIRAQCSQRDGEITVSIGDNGCGMTLDQLCNAMTYGSNERADVHSLGKFGLGLKTASTSQCRRVSLISRCEEGIDVNKLVLDIDHATKTNRWEYLEEEPDAMDSFLLRNSAGSGTGTVVRWDKCDRILSHDYKDPGGSVQQKALDRKIEQLRFHLGIVFQRFLDKEFVDVPNVEIKLNFKPVKPWDPFCTDLDETYRFTRAAAKVNTKFGTSHVYVDAYVIPSRDELDQKTADVVFPPNTNPDRFQGIYIYRENRLIHWGDWAGLYKTEFHQRLCRVALSFDATMDSLFNVDFKKSTVLINEQLATWMKGKVLEQARTKADKRYRRGTVSLARKESIDLHEKANKVIESKRTPSERHYSVQQLPRGSLQVENKRGTTVVEDKLDTSEEKKSPIVGVENLANGILWEPAFYKSPSGEVEMCVKLNMSHPYYQKAYRACKKDPVAIKALDYLIWSLAQAEYATMDQDSLENYLEMRIDVSRNLTHYVEDMPEQG